jgi:hypothetical protein
MSSEHRNDLLLASISRVIFGSEPHRESRQYFFFLPRPLGDLEMKAPLRREKELAFL